MDWFRTLIGPDEGADAQQLCIRAILLFFLGLVCIRLAGRRTFSQSSPLDIIIYLIVGSNLSRVMTGKADFWPVTSATLVLVVLHGLFAMLTLRWGLLAKVMKADPVVLIRDGVIDEAASMRHGISRMDLLEGLRLKQVADVKDVRLATLENSGKISVVPRKRRG
ncbi:DUF421 domain-containing protein [Phenylobacterium sp.]|uniref:DUF421 domain-containing protein n=1 Tax=Phenylobacterium sp. TaxID=1871053 RepID=UPI00120E10E3|nr:YetF domain-containing protein [Phenylobacterium sp.]THD61411.1 MAG: DUF421 domain-containing protein [Phenylobacterium sp.]